MSGDGTTTPLAGVPLPGSPASESAVTQQRGPLDSALADGVTNTQRRGQEMSSAELLVSAKGEVMFRLSVMRIVALVTGLVLANGGLFAQIRDLRETNPWPTNRNFIGMPDDDDEGDDEGDDCPAGLALLPSTSQTQCWDASGNLISCTGTGQDGEYQNGVLVDPRFTNNFNGTVTDNLTGLIWLKKANCGVGMFWADALSFSNTLADGSCNLSDGSVAGDWRLPNIEELLSLVDFGQTFPSLPPGHPFSFVLHLTYWSATTNETAPVNARGVLFVFGADTSSVKTGFPHRVWPVRGGQ